MKQLPSLEFEMDESQLSLLETCLETAIDRFKKYAWKLENGYMLAGLSVVPIVTQLRKQAAEAEQLRARLKVAHHVTIGRVLSTDEAPKRPKPL